MFPFHLQRCSESINSGVIIPSSLQLVPLPLSPHLIWQQIWKLHTTVYMLRAAYFTITFRRHSSLILIFFLICIDSDLYCWCIFRNTLVFPGLLCPKPVLNRSLSLSYSMDIWCFLCFLLKLPCLSNIFLFLVLNWCFYLNCLCFPFVNRCLGYGWCPCGRQWWLGWRNWICFEWRHDTTHVSIQCCCPCCVRSQEQVTASGWKWNGYQLCLYFSSLE